MILNTNFFPWLLKVIVLHNLTTNIFRVKAEKSAKKDGDIFDAKKEGYKPSEQRKTDQTPIDTQVDDYIEWLNHTCMMST